MEAKYLDYHLPVGRVSNFAEHLFNEQREVELVLCHVGQRRLLQQSVT